MRRRTNIEDLILSFEEGLQMIFLVILGVAAIALLISAIRTSIAFEADAAEINPYQQIWDNATDDEKSLTVRILALEAQGEPYEGEMAVVEVIFNRVLSEEFPDSIYGVLSQPGQFAAWRYLKDPYNRPTLDEYRAIDDVVLYGRTILPENYVFFATRKVNGRDFIKIGNHYFSH